MPRLPHSPPRLAWPIQRRAWSNPTGLGLPGLWVGSVQVPVPSGPAVPPPLSPWTSSLPTPSHARFPDRGVAPTKGGRTAGLGHTSHAARAGHRPRGPRPDRVCRARPCSGSAGRSGEWGSRGIAFPLPVWTDREGGDPFPSAPPLRVRGGSGCRPPPHLGVGRPGMSQYGRACHPKPGHDEGPAILSPDIWREGAFQRLPPPARVCQKRELAEPLP